MYLFIYIYILYIYIYAYTYVYIYIYRERESGAHSRKTLLWRWLRPIPRAKHYNELQIDSRRNSCSAWLRNMSAYSAGHKFVVIRRQNAVVQKIIA